MEKITTIEKLIEIIGSGEYRYYGLRGATPENIKQMERGYLECSYDFDHESGVPSETYLDGTCALAIREDLPISTIKLMYKNALKLYCAAHGTNTVLLIAGRDSEWGEDDDEIIIRNGNRGANVIGIVEI